MTQYFIDYPQSLYNCYFRSKTIKPPLKKTGPRPKTAPSLQRQTAGETRDGIQNRQVPQRQQTHGTLQSAQPDRGPDKDLVPESADEMEETADDAIEDGATPGPLHLPLLRPITPTSVFFPVHTVLLTAGLRLRSTHDGRNRRSDPIAGITKQTIELNFFGFE